MSECYVKQVSFKNLLPIGVSGELNAGRQRVPGSWTSMTEATFTKLRTSVAFDVVGMCWRTSDRVYGWIQRLPAQSQPSTVVHVKTQLTQCVVLVHQCTQLVLDSVLHR